MTGVRSGAPFWWAFPFYGIHYHSAKWCLKYTVYLSLYTVTVTDSHTMFVRSCLLRTLALFLYGQHTVRYIYVLRNMDLAHVKWKYGSILPNSVRKYNHVCLHFNFLILGSHSFINKLSLFYFCNVNWFYKIFDQLYAMNHYSFCSPLYLRCF